MSRRDRAPRIALIGLAIMAGLVVAAFAVVAVTLFAFDRADPLEPAPVHRPPRPRLETAGGADLAAVRARGQQKLSTYGWADRPAGLARIPIDRAMALTAERGWAEGETRP